MRCDHPRQGRHVVSHTVFFGCVANDDADLAIVNMRERRKEMMGGMCIDATCDEGGQPAARTPVNSRAERMSAQSCGR